MRCTDVILSALLSQPKCPRKTEIARTASEFILREQGAPGAWKGGLWALSFYLPRRTAKRVLIACLPEIRRRQMPSGVWKRKYAEPRSYRILCALKHAGLLDATAKGQVLKYDPFKGFAHGRDLYGYLVRRNVMQEPLPTDARLQRRLIRSVREAQNRDGSWSETVVMTALQLELLLELGATPDTPTAKKGAAWLLDQYQESVRGCGGGDRVVATVDSMFTTVSRGAEFGSAATALPEEDPKSGCFCSLPLIQTGLAIRALARAGVADDPRVRASCRSLLAIAVPEPTRWCAIGCRRMLERYIVEERKAARTARR